jgi:hypothetical protein
VVKGCWFIVGSLRHLLFGPGIEKLLNGIIWKKERMNNDEKLREEKNGF